MILTLKDLINIWGNPKSSNPTFNLTINQVCTDSRKINKGDLFIPLIGNNYDGHDFIFQAIKSGITATVVSKEFKQNIPDYLTYWIVEDTLKAYQKLALLYRRLLNIPVIAITGSVGKTTTRELIKSSLSSLGSISASVQNNNNDVGVPLTILDTDFSHKALILEMGMRGLNQIKCLSDCSEPDIAVITNIGTSHIGLLGNRGNIAKAKCEITSSLKKDGLLIIPHGDNLLDSTIEHLWKGRILRIKIQEYISDNSNNLFSENIIQPDLLGLYDKNNNNIIIENNSYNLPLEGKHNALNFLAAYAVAKELDIAPHKLQKLKLELPSGRNKVIKSGSITIMDETYNSSPESVYASLDVLLNRPGRHIVVLGEMLELGHLSLNLHAEVARKLSKLNPDSVIIISDGLEGEIMIKNLKNISNLALVRNIDEAYIQLKSWLKPNDVILLKASRKFQLDKIIPLLINLN